MKGEEAEMGTVPVAVLMVSAGMILSAITAPAVTIFMVHLHKV